MPSFQASQRRDLRRRLATAGLSATNPPTPESTGGDRPLAKKTNLYAQKALPEHHRSTAVCIPIRMLPFLAAVLGLLVVPSILAGLLFAQPQLDLLEARLADRWQRSTSAVRDLLDLTSERSLATVWGLACFLLGAALATITKNVRKHRLDDHQGRYRAWGWLTALFVTAALSVVVPLDRLVASLMIDATNRNLGGAGQGWWMLTVLVAWLPVGLWAVMPLTQRAAPGAWLLTGLASWFAASGIEQALLAGWQPWQQLSGDPNAWHHAALVLQAFAPTLAAVGTLVACRGVVREARGLVEAKTPRVRQQRKPRQDAARSAVAEKVSDADGPLQVASRPHEQQAHAAIEDDVQSERAAESEPVPQLCENGESFDDEGVMFSAEAEDDETAYQGDPRLSKAERRRLRKLAKKNRAA